LLFAIEKISLFGQMSSTKGVRPKVFRQMT